MTFTHYLTAANHCTRRHIPLTRIVRVSFHQWRIARR
jgi:hypothetical protein